MEDCGLETTWATQQNSVSKIKINLKVGSE
jgi:hypothetical protein